MFKQKLQKIFANPFYCGLISHGMLNGRLVERTHEKLITKELFLKVNTIAAKAGKFGHEHFKDNPQIPLKVFVKCEDCKQPFAGYIVKAKNLYYYKCRTKG